MHHRLIRALLLSCALSPVLAAGLHAQSLRGSQASVDHLYLVARASGLPFHANVRSARRAVAAGAFVPLTRNNQFTPTRGIARPSRTVVVRSSLTHPSAG